MKVAYTVVRILLGALFVFSSIAVFFHLVPEPELQGPMKEFTSGIQATGYFIPFLKGTELVCGILLLSGFFVPLATLILAPITIHILLVHVFLDLSGLPIGIFVFFSNVFLAYYHRAAYRLVLRARQSE